MGAKRKSSLAPPRAPEPPRVLLDLEFDSDAVAVAELRINLSRDGKVVSFSFGDLGEHHATEAAMAAYQVGLRCGGAGRK